MTTLEKIRAEICKAIDDNDSVYSTSALHKALDVIDKYAEQEPCEDCDYSEIVDWEQDAKTGKAKPIYWCERHKEPCKDAVSRQASLSTIEDMYIACDGDLQDYHDLLVECFKVLPSVQPKPKTGHWIDLHRCWICSECNHETHIEYKFCPNCSAKMFEPQESEDKE